MKKILFILSSLFLLSGCTPDIPDENTDPVDFGDDLDLTTLFAQICQKADGPCVTTTCNLEESTYFCAEKISDMKKNCSGAKSKDEVISSYQICGFETDEESEKYQIFNYSKSLELLGMAETPAELDQKIIEETAKVESGGTSDFLSTMLAVAGGSIIGGMISNALFNSNSAMPPRSTQTQKEEPFDKKKLDNTKKSTADNASKIKDSVSKTKEQSKRTSSKKKAAAKKASQKKSSAQKKSSSRKKSRRRR